MRASLTGLSLAFRPLARSILAAVAAWALLSGGVQCVSGATIGSGIQFGHWAIPEYPNNLYPGYQTVPSGSISGTRENALGSISAFAAPGALTVTARQTTLSGSLQSRWTQPSAYFADTVTIDAPGLTGQQGNVSFSFVLDGPLTATGDYSGGVEQAVSVSYIWGSDVGDGIIPDVVSYYDSIGYRSWNGWSFSGVEAPFLGREQTRTITFTYGQPFDFWVNIQARTTMYYGWAGAASATFSLTKWSGFKDITAGGSPVTNATLTCASGTDWVRPVTNTFANPPLKLTLQPGGFAQIVWPTNNIGGFALEYSTNLFSAVWLPVTNAVNIVGNEHASEVEAQGERLFYRLRRP